MLFKDLWSLVIETIRTQKLRSFLTILGIVVGMASIVLLSSISEGARQGIVSQFTQFGTNIIGVTPGKQSTFGGGPGAVGGTTQPLTIEDALALRRIPGVQYVAPHEMGMSHLEAGELSRYTYVYGTTWEDQHILQWYPRIGAFLPAGDPDQIPAVCVLGATVARELFPGANPLGGRIRIGGYRYVVVGVMKAKGQVLGFDMDDMVYIPVRRALKMFNRQAVSEIHVSATSHQRVDPVIESIRRVLIDRHSGEEDFTIVSQSDMLRVIDDVLNVVTAGVLVIAGISVLVGAMGILTIMWVSVHERTAEIGLSKAIGASNGQILQMFLAEAGALSLLGGIGGLIVGYVVGWILSTAIPGFWIETPLWVAPIVILVSTAVGILSGVIPAIRASRLDPIDALRAE